LQEAWTTEQLKREKDAHGKGTFAWQFQKSTKAAWHEFFVEGIATSGKVKNEPTLKCKKCSTKLGHPYMLDGGTSTLNRHPCYKKKNPTKADDQPAITSFTPGRIPREQVTAELVRQEAFKFIMSGNVAFAQADNPHLQNLLSWIKTVDEKEVKFSRKIVRRMLQNGSKEAREGLRVLFDELDSKVSLALDAWSSRNGYSFLGIFPMSHTNSLQIYNLTPIGV
jgi:hypothetical protein